MSDRILEGLVAIVTGAATGIGRGSAFALAAAGASVVVADRDDAQPVAAKITEAGGKAVATRCDIANDDEVSATVDLTVRTFCRLDILHANAGIALGQAPLIDVDKNDWEQMVSVNLTGTWLCLKHAAHAMIKQGRGGSIVLTSSGTGLAGFPMTGAYAATKAALINLTKTAAMELAEAGIRVNTVAPGTIATDMVRRAIKENPGVEEHLRQLAPLRRIGTVEEVANAVVWLSSPQASYITGVPLPVDGGYAAG
ncbi:glucose 1-dehydrogenase [Actinomadura sp. LD22]|uniref:Glucose 1-dehydrogenase n=1 Tax=Actinomadura physcomitrii TaxID=2650748 RepID=A0A6I4MF54_9ACTN|nr:glucose 1-dehydrogenase [Actinomadura physcomitrii]MWA04838.1 glucose 1-dehydrogenase [Actinomadura physcomitrii]